jgi:hypothetical protein
LEDIDYLGIIIILLSISILSNVVILHPVDKYVDFKNHHFHVEDEIFEVTFRVRTGVFTIIKSLVDMSNCDVVFFHVFLDVFFVGNYLVTCLAGVVNGFE